jgi:site-specific recombinase
MLVMAGLVLLAVWIVGIVGVYDLGEMVHVFLIGSFFLLLLAAVRSRDTANPDGKPQLPASKRDRA